MNAYKIMGPWKPFSFTCETGLLQGVKTYITISFLSILQVFDDCHEGGEISPSTCVYMAEWLDFWPAKIELFFCFFFLCGESSMYVLRRCDAASDVLIYKCRTAAVLFCGSVGISKNMILGHFYSSVSHLWPWRPPCPGRLSFLRCSCTPSST